MRLLLGVLVGLSLLINAQVQAGEPQWVSGKVLCGKAVNEVKILIVQSINGNVTSYEKTYPFQTALVQASFIASDFTNEYCDLNREIHFSSFSDPSFCCVVK